MAPTSSTLCIHRTTSRSSTMLSRSTTSRASPRNPPPPAQDGQHDALPNAKPAAKDLYDLQPGTEPGEHRQLKPQPQPDDQHNVLPNAKPAAKDLHDVQPDTKPGEQPNATNLPTIRLPFPLLLKPPAPSREQEPPVIHRPTLPLCYLAPNRLPLSPPPLHRLPSPSTTYTTTTPKVFAKVKTLVSDEGRDIYRFY